MPLFGIGELIKVQFTIIQYIGIRFGNRHNMCKKYNVYIFVI